MSDMVWRRGVAPFPLELDLDIEPPEVLYARGKPEALGARKVGIVGTRQCTAYGRNFAHRLGAELAEAGVVVVSGLAIGVDGAAHEGALAAGGIPIGVVATPLDEVYPRRHRTLWDHVGTKGLLLTETPPMAPRGGYKWNFPRRNRIIAALSEIVVVVESTIKGGSMHTVNAALRRSIDVMAVPGPVGSVASEGTNQLLVEGAAPCLGAEQVLDALQITAPRLFVEPPKPKPRISSTARAVLGVLDFVPMTTDRLVADSGLPRGEVMIALQELAAAGRANGGGGWWSRAPSG